MTGSSNPKLTELGKLTRADVSDLDGNQNLYIEFASVTLTFSHLILPGETIQDIMIGLALKMPSHAKNYMQAVAQIVKDFHSRCSDPSIIRLNEKQQEEFEYHWRKQIFRNLLDGFRLKEKISLEDAIQIVSEHVVIAPVMES